MDRIKKNMLGFIPCNIEIVVITPLKTTFNKLKEKLEIEEHHDKCFFENYQFKINKDNKKGLIVLAPQGIAAKDIVELFDNTKILFFGLSGSLNTNIKIGDMVEVECAIDEENKNIELVTIGNYRTVKCGYSPCLLGTIAKKYCDFYRMNNCDIVDMETLYCAKASIEKNNRFSSLQLISDMPEKVDFWKLSNEQSNELKERRIFAVDKIIETMSNLIDRD